MRERVRLAILELNKQDETNWKPFMRVYNSQFFRGKKIGGGMAGYNDKERRRVIKNKQKEGKR